MSRYTGKCSGFEDDGTDQYLCVCDHVVDEHGEDGRCEHCEYEEPQ